MTDFFAELEGHLHAAARRRARRGPRIALMATAATAAVVLLIAGLSAIDASRDPEVAAPAPTATATIDGCAEPPRAVLDRFAVLRREATDADRAPASVLARVDQDFPGVGRPEKVWPEAGRLARTLGDDDYVEPNAYVDIWLFPVALDGCRPGVCWVFVDSGETNMAYCHRLEEVRGPVSLVIDEGPEPSASALVPDGREAIGVNGAARVEGTTEGNVFFAKGATGVEEVKRDGCGTLTLSREAPSPELLDIVPGFRNGPLRMRDETWRKALGGQPVTAHIENARSFHTDGALDVFGVPYTPLPPQCKAEDAPTEAGVCLVAAPPQSEYFAHCFTATRITEGRALVHDLDVGLAYALVPARTKRATLGGRPMRIEGDFAFLVTNETAGRMELVR